MKPVQTLYLPQEKNFDRMIDICRRGARKDNVRVIIERHIKAEDGTVRRRIPVLEITPAGDVLEIPAPRFRTNIYSHLTASANLPRNKAAFEGVFNLALLLTEVRDQLTFERNEARLNARRKDRKKPAGKKPARTFASKAEERRANRLSKKVKAA